MTKGSQAREHVFYAELAGEGAKARLEARLAKEELTRLMGLWGSDVKFQVPNRLASLPKGLMKRDQIEAEALRRRVDLQMAKLDLEATARSYNLTEATRYVTDLNLLAGFETERAKEDGDISSETTGRVDLEFAIPIFDSGKARMRKAELAYMRAANLLAEKAVNVRSEARSAYQAYRANYDIARHYRNSVVPLRTKIEEQSLLTYNGMITSTFELLADSREKVNSILLAINAKRDFWLAEADLAPAIYGGEPPAKPRSRRPPKAATEKGTEHVQQTTVTRRERRTGIHRRLGENVEYGPAGSGNHGDGGNASSRPSGLRPRLQPGGDRQRLDRASPDEQRCQGVPSRRRAGRARDGRGHDRLSLGL